MAKKNYKGPDDLEDLAGGRDGDDGRDGELPDTVERLQLENEELTGQVEQLREENEGLRGQLEVLEAQATAVATAGLPRKNRLAKNIEPAKEGEIVILGSDPYFDGVARTIKQVPGGDQLVGDGCIRVMEDDPLAAAAVGDYLKRSSGDVACYGPMKAVWDRLKK